MASNIKWVELYNPTKAAVDISNWQLKDNAGSWNVPAGTTIAPGAYLTVARNTTAFKARYGMDSNLTGLTLSLANTGDLVRLVDLKGRKVDEVAWNNYLVNWSISATENTTVTRTSPGKDTNSRLDRTSNATPTPGR